MRDPASVVGLSRDGSRAWLAARLGRDTTGVYEFEVAAGRITKALAVDDRFDLNGNFLRSGSEPLALTYDALRPETRWFDAAWAERTHQLGTSEPAFVWRPVSVATDGVRMVFERLSDRQPARFAVVERDGSLPPRWLGPQAVATPPVGGAMSPVEFPARDGLALTGYVTLPETGGPDSRPLVVLVHGGPWARDAWEWRPDVQFLAAQGWAVLQVNYRGSAGFGRRFQEAGANAWNGAVTADLVEGARWAVTQRLADPSRIVIAGASFGGYLTASGLAEAPELFHAGASLGGVFNLRAWLDSAARMEPRFVTDTQRWRLWGDGPETRWRPRAQLAALRGTLLLVHAADDRAAPLTQSTAFLAAARKLGAPVQLIEIPEGGHTFGSADEQAAVWSRVEEFLARNQARGRREE